jgi:hypothetical protein
MKIKFLVLAMFLISFCHAQTTISFFGADFNNGNTWPPTDSQKKAAKLGSMRMWDSGVKWGQIETAPGVYDWTKLDAYVDKAIALHYDVLYTFGDTPQFIGTIPKGVTCLSPGPYSCSAPKDVNADGTGTDAAFPAFVTAFVDRYKGRVHLIFELWNEADAKGFWSGTTAQLVRMNKDAAAIIRSHDPTATIISPSVSHGSSEATWFDSYLALGAAAYFDVVNYHGRGGPVTNSLPETFLTTHAAVVTELAKRKITKPIWDDEWGILQGELTDPDMLASFVARSVILRASVGVARQYIYQWDSVAPLGEQGSLAGTAWDQVAGWLIGYSLSACTVKGTIYTCLRGKDQIVWDTSQSCANSRCTTKPYTFPSGMKHSYDLEGVAGNLSGKTVQLGVKPLLLTH